MKSRRQARRETRGNPFFKERVHDPYREREKLREPVRCRDCGAQYRAGRWRWPATSAQGLKSVICPACRRIEARDPAGELILSGSFLNAHRNEIVATIKHVESTECSEHPLNRIIAVSDDDAKLVITTTDIHLPHRIAHALKDAWGGTMKTHYDLEGYFTRVVWTRDD